MLIRASCRNHPIIHGRMLLCSAGGTPHTSGAKTNASSARERQRPPPAQPLPSPPDRPGPPHTVQTQASVTNAQAQAALSPIASKSSSASYIPKSSSSTGPISGQSPLDYDIYEGGGGGAQDLRNIHSLADIDERLDAINA